MRYAGLLVYFGSGTADDTHFVRVSQMPTELPRSLETCTTISPPGPVLPPTPVPWGHATIPLRTSICADRRENRTRESEHQAVTNSVGSLSGSFRCDRGPG